MVYASSFLLVLILVLPHGFASSHNLHARGDPGYAAPVIGTPCAQYCLADAMGADCIQCCRSVQHEIDWGCGTEGIYQRRFVFAFNQLTSLGATSCCTAWNAQCWDVNSEENFFHACGQCDTTPPVVSSPGPQTFEATSSAGALVSYEDCTATDNSGLVFITSTPESNTVFQIGDTTVTCTASDESANEATATFVVTVSGKLPCYPSLTFFRHH